MAKRPRLILASQSAARRRLLKRLGLKFRVSPAHLDEAAVQRRIKAPAKLVRELSILKAQAVSASNPDAFVIGSDQVLVSAGKVFGKPLTVAKACEQLTQFSGRTIELLTGVCLLAPSGQHRVLVHRTKMKFRALSREEILEYVKIDQPLECAGSFKFEERGIGLFAAVSTDDPTAIEGLPLLGLAKLLRQSKLL